MSKIDQFLKQGSKKWEQQAEVARTAPIGGGLNVPDGIYIAQITTAELGESASGRVQIKWGYTILEGDSAGEIPNSYDGLEQEQSFLYLAKKLRILGWDNPTQIDFEQLPQILAEIVTDKPVVKIQVKTKGEFTNIYVNQLIENYQAQDEDGDVGIADDDTDDTEEDDEEGVDLQVGIADDDTDDTEEDDEEGVDLQVGMKVEFTRSNRRLEGVVKGVDEEAGEASVLVANKAYVVAFDAMQIVPELVL